MARTMQLHRITMTKQTTDTTAPLTYTRRNGDVVLGKLYNGTVYPVTYSNRTQAERSAAKLGEGWKAVSYPMTRPFFVAKSA